MKLSHIASTYGQQVTHYFRLFLLTTILSVFSVSAQAETINLNTADTEALQYIPGIGQSKAEDIVQYRKENGNFKNEDDLLNVPGIGAKTLVEIKKYGSVSSGVSKLTQEMRDNPPSRKTTSVDQNADKQARIQSVINSSYSTV